MLLQWSGLADELRDDEEVYWLAHGLQHEWSGTELREDWDRIPADKLAQLAHRHSRWAWKLHEGRVDGLFARAAVSWFRRTGRRVACGRPVV